VLSQSLLIDRITTQELQKAYFIIMNEQGNLHYPLFNQLKMLSTSSFIIHSLPTIQNRNLTNDHRLLNKTILNLITKMELQKLTIKELT